jgi:hypothetical protein
MTIPARIARPDLRYRRGGAAEPVPSSTSRSRRFRARRRAGKAPITIEVDEAGVESLLVRHGLIPNCGSDDRDVIGRAIERLLEILIAADAAQYHE